MTMPVRDCLLIDAVLDNTVAVEIIGGDSRAVELGLHIREAGLTQFRQQSADHSASADWQSANSRLDIELESGAWEFVVEQLSR